MIKEDFINAIKALPYNIDEEIPNKKTEEIIKDVIQKYLNMYGTKDLSENDIECAESFVGKINKEER